MTATHFYDVAIGLLSTIMSGIVGILLRFFFKDFENFFKMLKDRNFQLKIQIHKLENDLSDARIDLAKANKLVEELDMEDKDKVIKLKTGYIEFLENRIGNLKDKLTSKGGVISSDIKPPKETK